MVTIELRSLVNVQYLFTPAIGGYEIFISYLDATF